MAPKTPVMLLVLVETARLRWFLTSVGLQGGILPLLRSEDGDLAKYVGLPHDEQLDFLRHRLCGVVQRGCDRLWARDLRASQFVFVFEGLLAEGDLTQAVADHFALWMAKPPAVTFASPKDVPEGTTPPLRRLAGELEPPLEDVLRAGLAELQTVRESTVVWQVSAKKA